MVSFGFFGPEVKYLVLSLIFTVKYRIEMCGKIKIYEVFSLDNRKHDYIIHILLTRTLLKFVKRYLEMVQITGVPETQLSTFHFCWW